MPAAKNHFARVSVARLGTSVTSVAWLELLHYLPPGDTSRYRQCGRVLSIPQTTPCVNEVVRASPYDCRRASLCDALYVGYGVHAILADKTLVQLPAAMAAVDTKRLVAIKVQALEAAMGNAIPAACDDGVAECWTKP